VTSTVSAFAGSSGSATRPRGASATQRSLATTSSATPTSSAPPTITVAAVGDLCFASSVRRLVRAKGPKAPFSSTHGVLSAADVTLGNLECALSTRGHAVPGKKYTFEGPPSAVKGLTYAGFDIVAQGNNHARDYGSTALKDTIANLDKAGIAHAGAGANSAAAFRPAIIKRNGATIAYLSFSQIGPASFKAGKHSAGTAYTLKQSTVEKAIRAAHKKADYVIVSFHWGVERKFTPTGTQVRFGRAAVRAGADLVLSHHPHVIEGVEFYKRGLIAYSLGNFVFSPGTENGHDTLVLTLALGPHGIRNVVARAAHIDPYGRPVLAKGKTRSRILGIVRSTSRGRHTKVKLSGGVAHLSN
jgi:poly-gamma-glutamate capsule biosynthesis protein CapA/YwtB (metallophosphatase superfamily)